MRGSVVGSPRVLRPERGPPTRGRLRRRRLPQPNRAAGQSHPPQGEIRILGIRTNLEGRCLFPFYASPVLYIHPGRERRGSAEIPPPPTLLLPIQSLGGVAPRGKVSCPQLAPNDL